MNTGVLERGRTSLVAGAVAWVAGIVFATLLLALFSSAPSTPVELVSMAAVFYYTFHLWPLVVVPGDLSATATVFAPVSMLLLFWAGFRNALRTDAATAWAGARIGSAVAGGYLSLALLSLPAYRVAVGTPLWANPAEAFVVVGTTGVLFPVVFGGFGGWIAGR